MIHITYYPSTDDSLSSGHILWEIFTVFIVSFLIDCKPIYNSTWDRCLIISKESFLKFTTPPLEEYDKIINIDNIRKWESINFDDFINIKNIIEKNKQTYTTILVNLSNVCKIHPDVLCFWYNEKQISHEIFSSKALPLLQNLYYYDHNNNEINTFAIHMRRGDLCKWCYDIGFTIDYYRKIINIINEKLNIPINIYTESTAKNTTTQLSINAKERKNINYNDISTLQNLKNVTIYAGTKKDLSSHFNELCRSKYLMISPSSFSLWAAFISKGMIFIDIKCLNRPNLFRHIKLISKFIVFDNLKDKMKEI